MNKGTKIFAAAVVLGVGAYFSVRAWKAGRAGDGAGVGAAEGKVAGGAGGAERKAGSSVAGGGGAGAGGGVLAADKAARVEKIRRDYEDIRAKMSADYGAAGQKFPGGLNAFLRQLALLEREMRADLAAFLTPRELEDYELRESATGQAVRRRIAGVGEAQQREVFRVQREFDDRFALVFDVSPGALLERVKVQQVAREKIHATLGDEAFAEWLRTEDPSYAAMRALAAEGSVPAAAVKELWRIKNEFTQRRLEIATQVGLTAEQHAAMQAALAEQTRSRVTVLVRPEALAPGSEALGWVPPGR